MQQSWPLQRLGRVSSHDWHKIVFPLCGKGKDELSTG